MSTHIWLRAESKPAEERTPLTPEFAGQLVAAGFRLTVEESSQSAFALTDYENCGCEIAAEHSWINLAPREAIILGLKELEASDFPLIHRHIHFAHVFKNQTGWERVLDRFRHGGGCLYDLEFLVDESGRRVAAFGHWAGFAGAALGLLAWTGQVSGRVPVLDPVRSRPDRKTLVDDVAREIHSAGLRPVVMVIGALGRCGRGAIELLEAVGVDVIQWDLEETAKGGPFREILAADVFLNCVFVQQYIQPFLTPELVYEPARRLSVLCDISCDPYGDYNPLPIYDRCTTFSEPVQTVVSGDQPLHLIAIDHLPSLLPRESSHDFCRQLMPHLLRLNDLNQGVWQRAYDLFVKKTSQILAK